jgi:hypothetical protein
LPGTGSKTAAHGIENIMQKQVKSITGYAKDSTKIIPLPFTASSLSGQIQLYLDETNITVYCGSDRSTFTEARIYITYK